MIGTQASHEFDADSGPMRLNLTTAACQAPKQNEDIYTFRKESRQSSGHRNSDLRKQMKPSSSLSRAIQDQAPKHYEKTTVCYLTKFTPSNQYRRA